MKFPSQIFLSASTALYLLSSPLMAMNEDNPSAEDASSRRQHRLQLVKVEQDSRKLTSDMVRMFCIKGQIDPYAQPTLPPLRASKEEMTPEEKLSYERQLAQFPDMKKIIATLLYADMADVLDEQIEVLHQKFVQLPDSMSDFEKHLNAMAQKDELRVFLGQTVSRAKKGTLFPPEVNYKREPIYSKDDTLSKQEILFFQLLISYLRDCRIDRALCSIPELNKRIELPFFDRMRVAHEAGLLEDFLHSQVFIIFDDTQAKSDQFLENEQLDEAKGALALDMYFCQHQLEGIRRTVTKIMNKTQEGTLPPEIDKVIKVATRLDQRIVSVFLNAMLAKRGIGQEAVSEKKGTSGSSSTSVQAKVDSGLSSKAGAEGTKPSASAKSGSGSSGTTVASKQTEESDVSLSLRRFATSLVSTLGELTSEIFGESRGTATSKLAEPQLNSAPAKAVTTGSVGAGTAATTGSRSQHPTEFDPCDYDFTENGYETLSTGSGDEFRGSGLGLGGPGSGSGRSETSRLESKGYSKRNTSGTTGSGSAGAAGSRS